MTAAQVTGSTSRSEATRAGKLVAIVLAFTTVVALGVLAFAGPAVNSGAADLPLAVSGPSRLVEAFSSTLESEGPDTFEVTVFASPDETADAIRDGDAVGGIVLDPSGVTIQTAAGAGSAYPSLLREMGSQIESSGQRVTFSELAPTTREDPRSVGVTALGLPLVFGGMGSAAALLLAYRGSVRSRVGAALTLAVLSGLVATAILQWGFGAFDGSYWLTAAAVSAGIAAISCTVLGLGTLLGHPGVLVAALLMLSVANRLSGLANGPDWPPRPWRDVGQLLPVGATGSAVRSAVYFDGEGATAAWLVLAGWGAAGLLLAGVGAVRSGSAGRCERLPSMSGRRLVLRHPNTTS